ncbi:MAG: two pore domain potassium channel family protein [Candidatus Diapherotrites archaeon]|nr:two pore domain potassium channel family protein [Candidatus Diapherotrites archaeon]
MVREKDTRKKRVVTALALLGVLLGIGTFAFSYLENWNLIDSFYFTGVTLATIGYGDLRPTTDTAKVFTVIFSFSALGTVLYCISVLAETRFILLEESEKIGIKTLKNLRINRNDKAKLRIRLKGKS